MAAYINLTLSIWRPPNSRYSNQNHRLFRLLEVNIVNKNSCVSFVVPAYNCAATIRESIESILQGNFSDGDEIIIVNDCSTDETGEVIENLSAHNPSIRVLNHLVNKGCAAAGRNTAIEHAKNPLIFCLDADNILAPSSIQPLKELLLETGADSATFQEMRFFDYGGKQEDTTHKWIYKEGFISLSDALSGSYWPGPSGNYLFTRESWLRAGRYNEFAGVALDSWAFGIRQLATGSSMITLPNSWYYHRAGYRSTYVRHARKRNLSLVALEILIPFLDLVEDADIEYIMGQEGRYTWFESLSQRPLRVKGYGAGTNGKVVGLGSTSPYQFVKKAIRKAIRAAERSFS